MSDNDDGDLGATLEGAIKGLEAELDPEARAAEVKVKLAPFEAGGPWFYAPESEKLKAQAAVLGEQVARAEQALWHLGRAIRDVEPVHEATVEQMKRCPSPEASFRARHHREEVSPELAIHLGILEQATIANLERTVGHQRPTAVEATYQRAVAEGDDAVMRWVERKAEQGWHGAPSDDAAEVEAAQRLAKLIREQRESRVPLEAKRVDALLSRARGLYDKAKTLHKLNPRRPENL